MEVSHVTTGICDALYSFDIETVKDARSLDEVFRLRYRIYCEEYQYESGQDGREMDQFDPQSRHVLLRHQPTRRVVGTVRLIIPRMSGPGAMLPVEQFVNVPRLRTLPRSQIAEVSRFALAREVRTASATQGTFARLALVRGIVQLSCYLRITHWCALMEPRLLRLLGQSGIHFLPLGGLIEHRGLRQPSLLCISEMLDRMQREKPAIWDFVTGAGALWSREVSGDAA